MSQEILLKEIKELGKLISQNKILNSNNHIYTVDKNQVEDWFNKIRYFTLNEVDYDLKEKLKTFIANNENFFNSFSSVIDENIFQRMKQLFRECFVDSNCTIGE